MIHEFSCGTPISSIRISSYKGLSRRHSWTLIFMYNLKLNDDSVSILASIGNLKAGCEKLSGFLKRMISKFLMKRKSTHCGRNEKREIEALLTRQIPRSISTMIKRLSMSLCHSKSQPFDCLQAFTAGNCILHAVNLHLEAHALQMSLKISSARVAWAFRNNRQHSLLSIWCMSEERHAGLWQSHEEYGR